MARKRQSAAARAASLRNLRKARSVNSKIVIGRPVRRRRRITRRMPRMPLIVGAGKSRAMRGGGIGDYITKLSHAFNRANGYLKSSKIISRGLKGLAIPVGAIRPGLGAALEAGGHFAGQFGYGKRRMRGGRKRMPHRGTSSLVYDSVGIPIR